MITCFSTAASTASSAVEIGPCYPRANAATQAGKTGGMSMLSGIMRCQPADIDIVGVAQSGHIRIAGTIPYFIGPALRSRIVPGLFRRMAVRKRGSWRER